VIDLRPPFSTHLGWIFGVFVGALLVFHLILVWPRNLTRRSWKIVDYVWLGTGLLGVIGSAGVGRQAVAEGLLATARTLIESFAADVESDLRFGMSDAVCRRFTRTEASPPESEFQRIQREFDAQCAWFRHAAASLKTSPFPKRETVQFYYLGGFPPEGGLDWASKRLVETLGRYNAAVAQHERLSRDARRTDLELTLIVVGPFLLVIALALRIAKVSGEMRYEPR
jgi:hypothetical protein